MLLEDFNKQINYLENLLIFMAACVLIFSFIPKNIQVPFLSGGNSFKLSWYFLMLVSVFWIYRFFKKNRVLSKEECTFIKYIEALVAALLVSNIMGLVSFPYYADLFNGSSSQIDKLPKILSFLHFYGIDVKREELMIIWIAIRAIKGVFLDVLYSFGFAFILYDIYKERWNFFFDLLMHATIVSVTILCLYSIIEILYLIGNAAAQNLLVIINPYIHPIAIANGWWPPLLWGGQLRSVFPEPSNMGNYLAFAIPFLWANFYVSKKINIALIVLLTFYTIMIFLTRARTAVLIYLGLVSLLVLFSIYIHKQANLKKLVIVLAITLIAFLSSIAIINNCINNNVLDKESAVTAYMENNISSIADSSKRSNGARYALIRSNVITGISHPLFGVGNLLGSAYTIHNLDEQSHQNEEVKLWIYHYNHEGVLKYSIDAMNEYVTRFANNGAIGLILYLFPLFYIIIHLIKLIKKVDEKQQIRIMFTLIAIIGTAVAGCNGSLNAFYTYWMVLPLGYAIMYGLKKHE